MAPEPGKLDARQLDAMGIAFMGAGLALTVALMKKGGTAGGIGLLALGFVFLARGISKKRAGESS